MNARRASRAATTRSRSVARLRAALAALLLAVAGGAGAMDVGDRVAALRAEPLSLFDWGLYQLERELQSVRRDERDFIRALYDAASGRIIVDGTFFVFPEEIAAVNPRRACYTRHHAIKLTLGIIDTDRLHVAPAAAFRFGLKFSHRDPENLPDEPDAEVVGEELMDTVEIRVAVGSDEEQFPFNLDMRCDGRLMSQEVFYDGSHDGRHLPD